MPVPETSRRGGAVAAILLIDTTCRGRSALWRGATKFADARDLPLMIILFYSYGSIDKGRRKDVEGASTPASAALGRLRRARRPWTTNSTVGPRPGSARSGDSGRGAASWPRVARTCHRTTRCHQIFISDCGPTRDTTSNARDTYWRRKAAPHPTRAPPFPVCSSCLLVAPLLKAELLHGVVRQSAAWATAHRNRASCMRARRAATCTAQVHAAGG